MDKVHGKRTGRLERAASCGFVLFLSAGCFAVSFKGFFFYSWFLPILVGAFCALLGLGLVVSYVLSGIFVGASIREFFDAVRQSSPARTFRTALLSLVLMSLFIFAGKELRKEWVHWTVCTPSNEMRVPLEGFMKDRGQEAPGLPGIEEITRFAERTGMEVDLRTANDGGSFSVDGIHDADLTIVFFENRYLMIAPSEYPMPGLFTSFHAWTRNSFDKEWEYTRIRSWPECFSR